MSSVEAAIRSSTSSGAQLATPQGAPFTIERIDADGVVLLLGEKQAWTRITWKCLEGIPDFLAGRGWVVVGSKYETAGDPTTLDGYLKGFIARATAGWVAVLLEQAGTVELDRSRPARVRLAKAAQGS